MTTFRLMRQTNRSSRFAQVTVEVAASSWFDVEVTAVAAGEHRREAELGARWALRGLTAAARVTVTNLVVTEVDTSVGDVYEATARAVWQALRVEYRCRTWVSAIPAWSRCGLRASWADGLRP